MICRQRRHFHAVSGLLSLVLLQLAGYPAAGATLTWNGGLSGDWQNGAGGWTSGGPANWNSATPDTALFAGVAPAAVTVNAGGVTVDDVTFSATGYSIGGTGTITLSNTTLDVGSGHTATITAALAGTTGLVKSGAGTLVFGGTNKSYTGGTTINAGVVQISSAAAGSLGPATTSSVTLNGGALHANFSANTNVRYAISVGASGGELRNLGTDSGRWQFDTSNTISGSGTLTLSFGSSNTRFNFGASVTQTGFTGKWVVDSGNNSNRFVDVNGSANFGNATGDDAITLRNTGALLLRPGVTLGGVAQGVTVGSGGARISSAGDSTTTIAGKLSGSAGNTLTLYIGANSIMNLSNTASSYAGNTSVNMVSGTGTLRLGAAGVVPDGAGKGSLSLGTGVTLDLNGFSETVNALGGSGSVSAGSGTPVFNVNSNGLDTTFSGSILNGAGVLSLTKSGSGSLRLTGSNNYSGGTAVNGGTLRVETDGALGAVPGSFQPANISLSAGGILKNNGGSLTLDANRGITLGSGGGVVEARAGTTVTVPGGVTGPGALTKADTGTLVLAAGNTFSGAFSATAGTVSIPAGSALGTGTAPITLGNAATLEYTGASDYSTARGLTLTSVVGGQLNVVSGAATVTLSGEVAGADSIFTKHGAGTFRLNGSATLNGISLVGGVYRQAGGETRINSISTGLSIADGTEYRLEAGVLRTDRINTNTSGVFTWGGGTLSMKQEQGNSGLAFADVDRTGPGGAASGPVVYEGSVIDVAGNLATSAGSVLDLGPTYLSGGLRYDQLRVSGSLDLSAAGDSLHFDVNPLSLRPYSPDSVYTGDWGTLRLVVAEGFAMNGPVAYMFDSITGISSDAIGWSQQGTGTDTFISPESLPLNSYYIEYRTSGVLSGAAILFHYKVAGSVPEPGTAGLFGVGFLLLRVLRRRTAD